MKLHGHARDIMRYGYAVMACPWSGIQHRRPLFIHGHTYGLLVL